MASITESYLRKRLFLISKAARELEFKLSEIMDSNNDPALERLREFAMRLNRDTDAYAELLDDAKESMKWSQ